MTRIEFNLVLKKMLVSMGEPENFMPTNEDTNWDDEYAKIKHLSLEEFSKVCDVGVSLYWRAEKAHLN